MGVEQRLRVFRSGNSVAIRLPKSFGFADGDEVRIVTHEDGSITLWRELDGAAVLDRLYGAFSPGFMAEGRGDIEQEERAWPDATRGSDA